MVDYIRKPITLLGGERAVASWVKGREQGEIVTNAPALQLNDQRFASVARARATQASSGEIEDWIFTSPLQSTEL